MSQLKYSQTVSFTGQWSDDHLRLIYLLIGFVPKYMFPLFLIQLAFNKDLPKRTDFVVFWIRYYHIFGTPSRDNEWFWAFIEYVASGCAFRIQNVIRWFSYQLENEQVTCELEHSSHILPSKQLTNRLFISRMLIAQICAISTQLFSFKFRSHSDRVEKWVIPCLIKLWTEVQKSAYWVIHLAFLKVHLIRRYVQKKKSHYLTNLLCPIRMNTPLCTCRARVASLSQR